MENKENYYNELKKVKCNAEKKGKLTYISWADAWDEVKKHYPDANYEIFESSPGHPYFESDFGINCKVSVMINQITHVVNLPVMDENNMAMKKDSYTYPVQRKAWDDRDKRYVAVRDKEGNIIFDDKKCASADMFDINKTNQRAFTKAIAMHGIGLYVYQGEDLPIDDTTPEKDPPKEDKPASKTAPKNVPAKKLELAPEKLPEMTKESAETLVNLVKNGEVYYDNHIVTNGAEALLKAQERYTVPSTIQAFILFELQ